jgi:hypothetical protein
VLLASLLLAGFGLLAVPLAEAAPPGASSAANTPAKASTAAPPPAAPAAAADASAPPATASPAAGGANTAAPANTPADTGGTRPLDEQIQDLKKDVVDLNRDLFVLEEELLFPANTQVAVFVSMDIGDFFALDSITLKIDNREVKNYLYTPREVAALVKGGVQQLYIGNLKAGSHELVALLNGKGPHDRYYRRGANLKFDKGVGAKYLELKITDHQRAQEPEFEIKDWE